MRSYFTSKTQKTHCIYAIEDSLTVWKYILNEMKKGNNISKIRAIDELKAMDPCPLHQTKTIPLNWCFLCQYVLYQSITETTDEEFEQMRKHYAAGMPCDQFCPVIWNPKDNSENKDEKDDCENICTPCESKGSPYYDYVCSHSENTVHDMCAVIEQALSHIKGLPVKK